MHRLQDLIRLHRQGEGSRVIARQLRMGRDTIRHYLRALKDADLLDGQVSELSELEILQRALAEQLPAGPLGPRKPNGASCCTTIFVGMGIPDGRAQEFR